MLVNQYPWEPDYIPEEPGVIVIPGLRKKPQDRIREVIHIAPRYNVVLLDDDEHSYEYVIEMLGTLFGYSRLTAFQMACTVDFVGRVIVDTTSKERAEFKRDQIQNFGADYRIPGCRGSMRALIEPVEDDG